MGAKIILKWKRLHYRNVFAVTAALVLFGVIVVVLSPLAGLFFAWW